MTDKELADAAAPLLDVSIVGGFYRTPSGHYLGAEDFVRDWRVTGAMMEKCTEVSWVQHKECDFTVAARLGTNSHYVSGESLPRAINEACVEALT